MRTKMLAATFACALAIASGAANAGCLKGAAVGGVAGHFAGHHGLLGAAAGCAIARHQAVKNEKRAAVASNRSR